MQKHTFTPTEIIFSATTECNLHCKHCFVSRNKQKLDIQTAINFLKSCTAKNIFSDKNNSNSINNANSNIHDTSLEQLPSIEKIGFSGGEPFLYLDFIIELTKAAIEEDLLFDQIMTNGDWWQNEEQLQESLQKLYDAGYDGKIGLSWDSFHGQKTERMQIFIKNVQQIFGNDSINIQSVKDDKDEENKIPSQIINFQNTDEQSDFPCTPQQSEIPVYTLPQTYPSENEKAWQAKHWFKEDWCQGPGNILYVHADGNIAPCCGFANENPELFIGKITDSFQTIMQNARNNKMINLCFEKGLLHYRHTAKKILKSQGKKLKGKCGDICSFCDFVCKLERTSL